jgi:hypothetical protein
MTQTPHSPKFEVDLPSVPVGDVERPPGATPQGSPPTPRARLGTSESAVRVGRQLAEQMDERGYHPVVIFGSSASGKSSLLTSLLAYLQVDDGAKIQLRLGEPFALDDDAYGQWAHDEATGFFYRSVEEFIGGVAHAATLSPNPFFIPVVIKPHGNLPEMKFAFLESRGDWYNPEEESNEFFQRLREEISSVLVNYQKGISFLHIAPYTQVMTWDESAASQQSRDIALRQKADLALVGALNSYKAVRVVKHRDAHLFLVTKWDAYAAPGGSTGSFSSPSVEEVTAVARERYPRAYAAFLNLSLEEQAGWQKQLMQYCSGVISGRSVSRPSNELRGQIFRYPRVLWSWLYANATRDTGHRESLFPAPPPRTPTLMDKFNEALSKFMRWLGV